MLLRRYAVYCRLPGATKAAFDYAAAPTYLEATHERYAGYAATATRHTPFENAIIES